MFRRRGSKAESTAATLAEVGFFEGFTPEELERVAELAREVTMDEGRVLIDQGRPGLECYVILDGEAGIFVRGDHVATLGPGSMVGEMALIDHRPRSATVLSQTPCGSCPSTPRASRTLLDEMPKARERVMSLLNARLQANEGR